MSRSAKPPFLPFPSSLSLCDFLENVHRYRRSCDGKDPTHRCRDDNNASRTAGSLIFQCAPHKAPMIATECVFNRCGVGRETKCIILVLSIKVQIQGTEPTCYEGDQTKNSQLTVISGQMLFSLRENSAPHPHPPKARIAATPHRRRRCTHNTGFARFRLTFLPVVDLRTA